MNAPRTRVQRRPVHGVLLLDKPLGLSSNQALQKAKWLLRAEKAGHTGTLDPLASGVLPLCFGAATKFSQLHLDADKTYEATARLGIKTSTGDAEGGVIAERPVAVTAEDLVRVEAQFTGPIRQVPPMHSALKKDGKALYEYARDGIEVERAARDVTIHKLALGRVEDDQIRILATVSKGTYIRTLGEDIGEALGCGAHLTALRRIATGGFEVSQCVTLEALEAMGEEERLARLLPTEALVAGHTSVTLGAEDAARFLSGLRRRGDWPDAAEVAVFGPAPSHTPVRPELVEGPAQASTSSARTDERAFLGTAHVTAGELIPGRLLNPIEIQQTLLTEATP
ncbi:tRNA pseudouridine(55) synthase TruB [Variovorax sp. LjRoot84]|uniref:tRNA pseudouridine(55) synthase TruB n=1 Tax=Variovorax sp. LjRoot84 TaxID=3342340 RepID=UPI003ECECC79